MVNVVLSVPFVLLIVPRWREPCRDFFLIIFMIEFADQHSLLGVTRLKQLARYVARTEPLKGINAEVGVYKGGSAYIIACCSAKELCLFDTFSGMPAADPEKDQHKAGDFSDGGLLHVMGIMPPEALRRIRWGIGLFPQTAADLIAYNERFSFVHIDCDLYSSTKTALEFFWPRMVMDGIVVLDDYDAPTCPGAKLATDEYLALVNDCINLERVECQIAIRKIS